MTELIIGTFGYLTDIYSGAFVSYFTKINSSYFTIWPVNEAEAMCCMDHFVD